MSHTKPIALKLIILLMASSIESLIARYQLTEENVNREITDIHIDVISRYCCSKWKSLPAHLKLATIVAEDINCKEVNEEDKRQTFLSTWKKKKGFEATYKTLISALLEIECRSETESVCKLLKDANSGAMSLQLPDEQQQDGGQQHQEQQQLNNRSTTSDSGISCMHITMALPHTFKLPIIIILIANVHCAPMYVILYALCT